MKQIKYYMVWMAMMAVSIFTSCSDDDAAYTFGEGMKIVSSNVIFDAAGGKGSIVVEGNVSAVKAASNAEWCKVLVKDANTVEVTIDKYTGYENRDAVVTLTDESNGDAIHAAVIQNGGIWMLTSTSYTVSNKGADIVIPVKADLAYDIEASNWIKDCKKVAEGISVKIAENKSGKPRMGTMTLKNERDESTVITFTQFDITDIEGEYHVKCDSLFYDDWYEEDILRSIERDVTVKLVDEENGIFHVMGMFANELPLVMNFNKETSTMSFEQNQRMGALVTKEGRNVYVYSKAYSYEAKQFPSSSTLNISAPVEVSADGVITYGKFTDITGFVYRSIYGSETGYCNGIASYFYSSDSPERVQGNMLGYGEVYCNVLMTKN